MFQDFDSLSNEARIRREELLRKASRSRSLAAPGLRVRPAWRTASAGMLRWLANRLDGCTAAVPPVGEPVQR